MTTAPTKDRILDSAEKLIADNGVSGTSLRAIIKDAGVNLAAVHYHFGSREGLLEAVVDRRAGPVNERRLAMLDALESGDGESAGTERDPVLAVVNAFVLPITDLLADGEAVRVPQLMGRLLLEPSNEAAAILKRQFGDVFRRFAAAFARVLPELSEEEVQWRLRFMIGAMAFGVIAPMSPAKTGTEVPREMVDRLIEFVTSGMRAGLPAPSEGRHR